MSVETTGLLGEAPLFSAKDTMAAMQEVQSKIEREVADRPSSERAVVDQMRRFIFLSLKDFQTKSKDYDESCGFNKAIFFNRFTDALWKYDGSNARVCDVFVLCYRFVCEFDFVTPEGVSNSLGLARDDLSYLNFDDYSEVKSQYRWANTVMPIKILKTAFNQDDLRGVKDFGSFVNKASGELKKFETMLSQKVLRVEELEKRLRTGEQDLNFALLNKGFSSLKEAKVVEKKQSLKGMWGLGIVLIAAPILKLFNFFSAEVSEQVLIASMVALVGFELLLIYFFRIFLNNFRSLSQQILQIDLRMTLCSFIESYSDFAVKTREGDKDVLSKFEQIIFSEVSFGDAALPSAFDGIEHVSSVFGKVRAK